MTENTARHGMIYACGYVAGILPEKAPDRCPHCGEGEQAPPAHEWL